MFGLLELSRQRLRSSLIDKSFEKCNYCKGSGLILNNSSISDQIIKVIKEKLSNEENLNLSVKCNTALAETLINLKKHEINNLESKYNSNINFVFNDHFSLHEPIVESQKKELEEKKQKNIIKNTKIKTSSKSKSNIKKKTKKAIKNIQRKNTSIKKSKEKTEQLKSSPNPDELKNSDIVEEKSGWWS